MTTLLHRWLLALMTTLAAVTASCADTTAKSQSLQPLSSFPQSTLSILTADGRQHTLNIWVADTDAHRQQGLMMVQHLPDHSGMLFVFDRPQRIQMWMKNTLIPLDMLFIDANGRIDSIAANTTPMSLKIIASDTPVLGVLEVAGGTANQLGIRPGSLIRHPVFGSVAGQR